MSLGIILVSIMTSLKMIKEIGLQGLTVKIILVIMSMELWITTITE